MSFMKKEKRVRQHKQGNQLTAREGRKGLSHTQLRTNYIFICLEKECLGICDHENFIPRANQREVAAALVISQNLRMGPI